MYATNDTHTVFLQIGSPDLVILLACSNQQLRQRLEKRASQQGRPDDNAHAIEKRLDTFKHNITLIAKYYQERGLIVRVRCCSLLIFILTVEFSWFSQHGLFCGWLQMLLCLKNCLVLCCETQFCLTVLGQVDADREEDDIFTDICTIVKERLFPSDTNAVGF